MVEFSWFGYLESMTNERPITTQTVPYSEPDDYQYPEIEPEHVRMKWLPAILFLLTLASTFLVGVCQWNPYVPLTMAVLTGNLMELRKLIIAHWDLGLMYMFCVVLILLLHEMGHFVATLVYRVPASFPIFLPFPLNPIGTFGAVIGMEGMAADRKQIFDIGIAGPLAGLVAAVPIAYWGVSQLDLTIQPLGGIGFRLPLLMQWFAAWSDVPGYQAGQAVWLSQLNPLFVAGWVGLFVTGLNMMPIGQLDGGHVTYTLFGRTAHLIARVVIVLSIAFMVYYENYMLGIMVVLVLVMGTDHPPTRDDSIRLGGFRFGLGLISLTIPILCFPPLVFQILN